MSEHIPFRERLWVSTDVAQQVLAIGKTKLFEKIANGEFETKKEGVKRLISVQSLLKTNGPRPTGEETP
jgi:hypothetical protein